MQLYEITDFQLAVTLYTLGHRLIDVDASSRRAVFKFEHTPAIDNDADRFFRDELRINPRHILTNTRLVKDRIYARQ